MKVGFFLAATALLLTLACVSCTKPDIPPTSGMPNDTAMYFKVSFNIPASTDTVNFQTAMARVPIDVNDYIVTFEDSVGGYHVTIDDLKHWYLDELPILVDTFGRNIDNTEDANNNMFNFSFKPGENPHILMNPTSNDPNGTVFSLPCVQWYADEAGNLSPYGMRFQTEAYTTKIDIYTSAGRKDPKQYYWGFKYKLVKPLTHRLQFDMDFWTTLSFKE